MVATPIRKRLSVRALDAVEADASIGAIVLTGDETVFAVGADIKGMKDYSYMDAYKANFITRNWKRTSRCRKPVIAAVAGYALGGGCELAMMCDFILAADTAKFGQPERRTFHAVFATADQKEGMDTFTSKRTTDFKHQ